MEHPRRWLILAGLSFLVGIVSTIAMLAYVVPHPVARVWLILWLLITAGCLLMALADWKRRLDEQERLATQNRNRTIRTLDD